jgi:hypothetical protein
MPRCSNATPGGDICTNATPAGYRDLTADLVSRLIERSEASDSKYEVQERVLRDLKNVIDKLQKKRDA